MNEIRCKVKPMRADQEEALNSMASKSTLWQLTIVALLGIGTLGLVLFRGIRSIFTIFLADAPMVDRLKAFVADEHAFATAVVLLVIPAVFVWLAIKKRKHRQDDAESDEVEYVLTPHHFAVEYASGSFRIAWTEFIKWEEKENQFLFYETDERMRFLPKRALAESELARLREWLKNPIDPEQVEPDTVTDAEPEGGSGIRCSGKITYEEYRESAKDNLFASQTCVAVIGAALALILTMQLFCRLFPEQALRWNNGHPVSGNFPMSIPAALGGLIVAALIFRMIRRARKDAKVNFEKDDLAWGPIDYLITPEFIQTANNRAKGRDSWDTFVKCKETKRTLLLHYKSGAHLVFPKRLLAPDRLEQVKDWIQRSIGYRNG